MCVREREIECKSERERVCERGVGEHMPGASSLQLLCPSPSRCPLDPPGSLCSPGKMEEEEETHTIIDIPWFFVLKLFS